MSVSGAWAESAARIARAVARRERLGAWLKGFGSGALAGGVAGIALGGAGVPRGGVLATVGAGALLGAFAGLRAARRVPPVRVLDAAWALDRVAGAGEAGLAEIAGGATAPLAPPQVHLLPTRGLALGVGGALVAGLACAIPGRSLASDADGGAAGGAEAGATHVVGVIDAPAALERDAQVATEAARVRQALGLPSSGEPDREAVAAALRDEAARRAAREAAEPGSALAQALADPAGADAEVQRALVRGHAAAAALEAARRAQAALALSPEVARVPAERRALVARYMARLRASEVLR
jgi:hypothetical protein